MRLRSSSRPGQVEVGKPRTDTTRRCWSPSVGARPPTSARSEEHTSELQSLMRISYAVFCLKKKKKKTKQMNRRMIRESKTDNMDNTRVHNTTNTKITNIETLERGNSLLIRDKE